MEIDEKPVVPRVRDLNVNFVDDDELQAALASSRRAKIKTKKITPEEIAKRSRFFTMRHVYPTDNWLFQLPRNVRVQKNALPPISSRQKVAKQMVKTLVA